MTDQEWHDGIERALNGAWEAQSDPVAIKRIIAELVNALPLRIALVCTGKDQAGHFRVGPARDEAA